MARKENWITEDGRKKCTVHYEENSVIKLEIHLYDEDANNFYSFPHFIIEGPEEELVKVLKVGNFTKQNEAI